MVSAVELHVARTGDCLGDIAAGPDRLDLVAGAVEDECRDADGGKQPPDVHVAEHLLLRVVCAGARADTLEPREPCDLARVAGQRGSKERQDLLGVAPRAPAVEGGIQVLLPLLLGPLPRVVGRLRAARRDGVKDESAHPLRIRRRQHRAQGTRVRIPEQHRPLRANCVQHGQKIVGQVLERWQVVRGVAIRDAGATPVDDDQPRKGG